MNFFFLYDHYHGQTCNNDVYWENETVEIMGVVIRDINSVFYLECKGMPCWKHKE